MSSEAAAKMVRKAAERKILIYSGDPGGAEAVAPVLARFPTHWHARTVSKASGIRIFRAQGISPVDCGGWTWPEMAEYCRKYAPDALLMSASSLVEKDATEMRLRRWAKASGVPCLAVMDNWQNYALRFRKTIGSRLANLPLGIAVMDAGTVKEMVAEGFSRDLLIVTGHPGLENSGTVLRGMRMRKRTLAIPGRKGVKRLLHLCLFSQPVRDFWGDSLGYDEFMVARDIMDLLPVLEAGLKSKVRLTIKLHPKESLKLFHDRVGGIPKDVRILDGKADSLPLLAECDVAVGMGTIMLVKAALGGVPAVCYAPGSPSVKNDCILTKRRLIPVLRDKGRLALLLEDLARVRGPGRKAYLKRQAGFGMHSGAADKVVQALKRIARLG